MIDESPMNVKATTMTDVTVVRQKFERGGMLWFAPGEPEANGTIFALMDTGQWWRGEDDWDGIFELDDVSPPGLIMPKSGFGNAWAWMGFKDVLGFATSGEEVMSGHHAAWQDGWELFVGTLVLQLRGSDEWVPPESGPEPEPEPEPGLIFKPGLDHWVWLDELEMPVNLVHVVWVGVDRLRIGPHDIVLSLPPQTALTLRAYVKTLCVKII